MRLTSPFLSQRFVDHQFQAELLEILGRRHEFAKERLAGKGLNALSGQAR